MPVIVARTIKTKIVVAVTKIVSGKVLSMRINGVSRMFEIHAPTANSIEIRLFLCLIEQLTAKSITFTIITANDKPHIHKISVFIALTPFCLDYNLNLAPSTFLSSFLHESDALKKPPKNPITAPTLSRFPKSAIFAFSAASGDI